MMRIALPTAGFLAAFGVVGFAGAQEDEASDPPASAPVEETTDTPEEDSTANADEDAAESADPSAEEPDAEAEASATGTESPPPPPLPAPPEDAPADFLTPPPSEEPSVEKSESSEGGLWTRWQRFLDGEIEKITARDLYGNTFPIPKGFVKFKYGWSTLEGDRRYDENGDLGPVIPRIDFEVGGQRELAVDLGLSGSAKQHFFQVIYGLTDNVSVSLEMPLINAQLRMDPEVSPIDDAGNTIGSTAAGFFGVQDRAAFGADDVIYTVLPSLGRPAPDTEFRGKWIQGDLLGVVAWNNFRTRYISSAMNAKVIFPTAWIPDPNQDLFYGTGPQLQVGVGGWALAASQIYDVRLVRKGGFEMVLTTDLTGGYGLPQKRRYPTNFTPPVGAAASLDPAAFPDLSNLEGRFTFTPGWNVAMTNQLTLSYLVFGVGVSHIVRHAQKPEIKGDPAFESMVDALGLLGLQNRQEVKVAVGVSLIPFYIPARIIGEWQRVVGGRNVLLYDNHFGFSLEFVTPVWVPTEEPS